ncbi:MAG TPA: SUMF1/EgtB/PvdO family nonheme iron enzyme, partial [Thermoanaerobaculia bacterium]|nr:SUMF1/EgtB/PvdO family nonheme iron enzyme [Thermoanaerobaculia bacterium]
KALQVWGKNVRFVVLSACNTALAARQLANKGIPAVGMAAPILGHAAVSFSQRLYEALMSYGLPMDDAVNRARSVIRLEQEADECGWLSPVLFLPQGNTIPLVPSHVVPVPPANPDTLPPPSILSPPKATRLWHLPWRLRNLGVGVAATLALLLLALVAQHAATRWSRVPPEMVRIPAGKFTRGGESTPMINLLRRFGERVKLEELIKVAPERGHIDQSYFIDRYEVTNESYARFLRWIRTQPHGKLHPREPAGKDHTPGSWGNAKFNGSDQPVVSVDAYDAVAYCQWAAKRLPTSAEWERAARGTDGRLYPWGNEFHKEDANAGEGPELRPVKGGSYPRDRSPDGVFDVGGNAAEWTSTPEEFGGAPAQAVAGASWTDLGEVYGLTFLRRSTSLNYRGENVGFRCARSGNAGEPPPGEMIFIPAGEFARGGEDSALLNLIRHTNVTGAAIANILGKGPERAWLDEFLLDRHEVTNREYGRFSQATAASQATQGGSSDKDHTPAYWQEQAFNQPDQPVVGVDWRDADSYCRWAGKRLPTSKEWERAARGTKGRRYPWGDAFDPNRCNTQESLGEDQTSAVASHPRCVSPEGFFDLVGNADEWTADKPSKTVDMKEPRVVRGGGWSEAGELRGLGYLEIAAAGDYRGKELGFRCAKTPRRSWFEEYFVRMSTRFGRLGRN